MFVDVGDWHELRAEVALDGNVVVLVVLLQLCTRHRLPALSAQHDVASAVSLVHEEVRLCNVALAAKGINISIAVLTGYPGASGAAALVDTQEECFD